MSSREPVEAWLRTAEPAERRWLLERLVDDEVGRARQAVMDRREAAEQTGHVQVLDKAQECLLGSLDSYRRAGRAMVLQLQSIDAMMEARR